MTEEQLARLNKSFDRYAVVWCREAQHVIAEYRRVKKLSYRRNQRKRRECLATLRELERVGTAFLEKRRAATGAA